MPRAPFAVPPHGQKMAEKSVKVGKMLTNELKSWQNVTKS